jgi:hypothetical protein
MFDLNALTYAAQLAHEAALLCKIITGELLLAIDAECAPGRSLLNLDFITPGQVKSHIEEHDAPVLYALEPGLGIETPTDLEMAVDLGLAHWLGDAVDGEVVCGGVFAALAG